MKPLFIALILGSATILGIFICINLIILKKGNQLANRTLAFLVLIFSAITFQNVIGFSGYYYQLPHMVFVFYPFNGLVGPLFFLYILFQLNPNRSLKWRDAIHALGFIVLTYQHIEFLMEPALTKIKYGTWIYSNKEQLIITNQIIAYSIKKLYEIIYIAAALFLVYKKSKELKGILSSSRILHLRWLKNFSLILIWITIINLILYFYFYFFQINKGYLETYIIIIKAVIINIIGFMMFQYTNRFTYIIKAPDITSLTTIKNENETISVQEVIKIMESQKPYLNPELKIQELSEMLSISKLTLSSLLNKGLGLSFYDFINQYRVNEFKNRIEKNQHKNLSLLGVAFEVGFNSKSSFNRIFKKQTGQTPSQYLNNK